MCSGYRFFLAANSSTMERVDAIQASASGPSGSGEHRGERCQQARKPGFDGFEAEVWTCLVV